MEKRLLNEVRRMQELSGLGLRGTLGEGNGGGEGNNAYKVDSEGNVIFRFSPSYTWDVDSKLHKIKVEANKYGVAFDYELTSEGEYGGKAKVRLETPSFKDQGFTLVGSVETTSAGNLVYPSVGFEGDNLVSRYGTGQFRCSECGATRSRIFYHIFRNNETGEDTVYGNDCAQRKFGVDFLRKIESVIRNLGMVVNSGWAYDEHGDLMGRKKKREDPKNSFHFLFEGALIYYSSFKSYARGGQVEEFIVNNFSVEDNVRGDMSDKLDEVKKTIENYKRLIKYKIQSMRFFGLEVPPMPDVESDTLALQKNSLALRRYNVQLSNVFYPKQKSLMEQLKDFYENTYVPKANNEFDTNMKVVVLDAYNRGVVKAGKNGLFLYAVWFWFKKNFIAEDAFQQQSQGPVTNEFFGEVGQSVRNLKVTCVNRTDQPQRGQYGDYYRYNLKDGQGYKFTFYNSVPAFMDKDAEYTIDAEISKHQEYAENKVTVLRNVVKVNPGQQSAQTQASLEPARVGGYVGEVGQRLKGLRATVTAKAGPMGSQLDGYYFKYEFDYNGNSLFSFTSRDMNAEPGQAVMLTGTVKAQKEYKGKKTTQLNRIVIEPANGGGNSPQAGLSESKGGLRSLIRALVRESFGDA